MTVVRMWSFLLLFNPLGGLAVPSSECESAASCPAIECHSVECNDDWLCQYTRLPVSECCLTHEECCVLAGAHETGLCIDNECAFVKSCEFQCITDHDCADTNVGRACVDEGVCFVPLCRQGWCECLHSEGMDLDGDGVPCPEDCNDFNENISTTIVDCFIDADGDGAKPCNVENGQCSMCIEAGKTCPEGWTHSGEPLPEEYLPTEDYEIIACDLSDDDDNCDCCDADPYTHVGSPFTSTKPNSCGSTDYNCNGEEEHYACCGPHQNASSPSHVYWDGTNCLAIEATCGYGEAGFTSLGWACEVDCAAKLTNGKEFILAGNCPPECHGSCVCVDQSTPPAIGECAKFVPDAFFVNDYTQFTDEEACCINTVQ